MIIVAISQAYQYRLTQRKYVHIHRIQVETVPKTPVVLMQIPCAYIRTIRFLSYKIYYET